MESGVGPVAPVVTMCNEAKRGNHKDGIEESKYAPADVFLKPYYQIYFLLLLHLCCDLREYNQAHTKFVMKMIFECNINMVRLSN